MATEIRRLSPAIPILLVTGYLKVRDRAAAVRIGINGVVEKPVPASQLLTVVQRLLAVTS